MIASLLFALLAGDDDLRAGARYRLWAAELDGSIRSDEPAVPGTDVRFVGDLGLDQRELLHDLGAWLRIPDLGTVRLSWWFGEFAGSETLDQTITFEGTSYSAGSRVRSEVSLDVVSAGLDLSLFDKEDLGTDAEIWFGIALDYVSASAKVTSDFASETGSLTGILPVVGLRGNLGLSKIFRVEAEVSGLGYSGGDVSLRLIDAALEVRAAPWEGLVAGLGYRLLDIFADDESADNEEVEADVRISGFYLVVGWRF